MLEKMNFKKVFVDLTVKSMVNPDNKDFYIKKLSLEQVKNLLTDTDDDLVDCFWTAFTIACGILDMPLPFPEVPYVDEDEFDTCPECGCRHYIVGVACPNCDYVEC